MTEWPGHLPTFKPQLLAFLMHALFETSFMQSSFTGHVYARVLGGAGHGLISFR